MPTTFIVVLCLHVHGGFPKVPNIWQSFEPWLSLRNDDANVQKQEIRGGIPSLHAQRKTTITKGKWILDLKKAKTVARTKRALARRKLLFWFNDFDYGESAADVYRCHEFCWGGWGEWSPCSKDCGAHGLRTRLRSVVTTHCACPGRYTDREGCNVFCPNGGEPVPGDSDESCICAAGFSGECCELLDDGHDGNTTTLDKNVTTLQELISRTSLDKATNLKEEISSAQTSDDSILSLPIIIGIVVLVVIILAALSFGSVIYVWKTRK